MATVQEELSLTVLERVKEAWRPRFLANGIEPFDYETTTARIHRWEDWAPEWRRTADEHVASSDEAERAGHLATAAHYRRLAALCLHFGHFNTVRPREAWLAATRRKVELYALAAPYLDPPAERVEIPFESIILPAYVRKPRGVERPPVIVFLSGLDSTKEEHATFEQVLLGRGLATVTFDGPGQGEVWEKMPGRVDWERAVTAVIDWVEKRRDLDAKRIVAAGVSLGGYFVARSAALEKRIRAAACIGGRFDQEDRDLTDPMHAPRFLHFWNADAASARKLMDASTLEGIIQKLDRPILVVHGAKDSIAAPENVHRVIERTGGPSKWVLYPEGNHVCNNVPHKYRPLVADWLVDQLP